MDLKKMRPDASLVTFDSLLERREFGEALPFWTVEHLRAMMSRIAPGIITYGENDFPASREFSTKQLQRVAGKLAVSNEAPPVGLGMTGQYGNYMRQLDETRVGMGLALEAHLGEGGSESEPALAAA